MNKTDVLHESAVVEHNVINDRTLTILTEEAPASSRHAWLPKRVPRAQRSQAATCSGKVKKRGSQ